MKTNSPNSTSTENNITTWQQLTITTQRSFSDDVNNWLQLKGAISITIIDNGDQPIYEPGVNETPLWHNIKISAIFDQKVNIYNLINQLNYDFSSDVIEHYEHELVTYDIEKCKTDYTFDPVCFANKLWLYPYNQFPAASQNRCFLNLEPGLAFGSGEHPTTSLCLEWLAKNITPSQHATLLDYGCGSGILAIAAIKLGIARALAVDNDPQAILATTENARRNNILDQVSVYLPNELPYLEVDYIVANILANPLIELSSMIVNHLKPRGKLILSGVLYEQTDEVALAYMNCGITLTEITRKGAWVRIVGEK